MSYTYDAQHRLLTASGPHGYAATYTYSPAGNVQSAYADALQNLILALDGGLQDPRHMNLYAFSLNNLMRYYDPGGRSVMPDNPNDPWSGICKRVDVFCGDNPVSEDADVDAGSDSSEGSDAVWESGAQKCTADEAETVIYTTLQNCVTSQCTRETELRSPYFEVGPAARYGESPIIAFQQTVLNWLEGEVEGDAAA